VGGREASGSTCNGPFKARKKRGIASPGKTGNCQTPIAGILNPGGFPERRTPRGDVSKRRTGYKKGLTEGALDEGGIAAASEKRPSVGHLVVDEMGESEKIKPLEHLLGIPGG